MKTKAICVIPARYDSKRLPGKVLADINGKSMLQRVYERAMASNLFEKVVIAAGCDRVFKAAKNMNADSVLVTGNVENGTQRVTIACGFSDCKADVVVNLQADMPFVHAETLEAVLRPFEDRGFVICSTVATQSVSPDKILDISCVKVVINEEGNAMYFSRSPIPHRDRLVQPFLAHMGVYAFRREFLPQVMRLRPTGPELSEGLEQLRIIGHGYKMAVEMTTFYETEVNTPEDLKIARRIAPAIDAGKG